MVCPKEIQSLYLQELDRRRPEDNFMQLIRRRGDLPSSSEFDLVDNKHAGEILEAWYQFHKRAYHEDYQDFYSKILYCQNIEKFSPDSDTFLELIADRGFLFLEFNESCSNSEYPLLSELVRANKTTAAQYSEEKCKHVLEQAFMPTKAHRRRYYQWRDNADELQEARTQRKSYIEQFTTPLEPFTVPIETVDGPLSKIDAQLDTLFQSYVEACSKYAYVIWYAKKSERERLHWQSAIRCVQLYLAAHPSPLPGYAALVFFVLFTQNAEGLLNASLSSYQFKPRLKNQPAIKSPASMQARVRERIRCNILLFDQLLELFIMAQPPQFDDGSDYDKTEREHHLEQYRCEAKYIFYLYSRYDRYWHYDLSGFWNNNQHPNIGFTYPENYKDGVDFFGNLLRYHINYCIPSQVQWLLPTLSRNREEPPTSVLATLLLAEGARQIPARNRLINRLQQILKTEEGTSMLETYACDFLDEDAVKFHLEDWCKRYQLRVPKEEALVYEPGEQNVAVQTAGRYILEYFLRDKLIQRARCVLLRAAKNHFESFCFHEFFCEP